MAKINFLCPSCGKDDVLRDAFAQWDIESQTWELLDVYDNFSCNACGAEFRDPDEEEIDVAPDNGAESSCPQA